MKKQKYSNGSLVVKKDFKGVGSLEGNLSGNQNQRSGELKATINLGSGRLTASKFKNSMGDSSTNYSVEKQLSNNTSVNAYSGKGGIGGSLSKTFKGTGITVGAGVNRNAGGEFSASMSIQKPL